MTRMGKTDTTTGEKRGRLVRVISRVLAILAIALAVEVLVFNANYFRTMGNTPVDLTPHLAGHLPYSEDGSYMFTVAAKDVTFEGIDRRVDNIVIDFEKNQPAQVVPVRLSFTDDAHSTFFYGNDYATGVPDVAVTTNVERSHYVGIESSGNIGSLRIEVTGEDTYYPLKIDGIYLNGAYPFEFVWLRFLLLAGVFALLYAFRPRSSIYKRNILDWRHGARRLVTAAVCIELVLCSAFMFYDSGAVGVATSMYNYGQWDGRSIVNTFGVGGSSARQYADLARAFVDGQLYLEAKPPEWLAQIDDPYDNGARADMAKKTGESAQWDTAYYNGRYYVYYGVVPCLLFYLPFYLITGSDFPPPSVCSSRVPPSSSASRCCSGVLRHTISAG